MPKKKPLIGRPPKPKGEKFVTPMRSGRCPDSDWDLIAQAAALSSEKPWAWLIAVGVRAAKRAVKS